MADLITLTQARPTDWAGDFVPGARATFYLSGTTTPATVYADEAGTIPLTQPVQADGDGVFPPIYRSAALKAVITDADGTPLPGSPIDPCVRSITALSAASQVPFTPTADIAETNVQDAVESVQANLTGALTNAGVGVTQAPVLANLNATNLTSGRFRYTGSTTGTFPAGVTAADGGVVVVSSGATGNQVMELTPRDGNIKYQRTMVSLTWGAWDEIVVVPAATAGDVIYRGATGWERLAKGTAGQVLAMNAGATAPEFTSARSVTSGQTWQDMSGSRAHSTAYTATVATMVNIIAVSSPVADIQVSINGSSWVTVGRTGLTSGYADTVSFVVAPGEQYRINGSATIEVWAERRA